MILFIYSLVFEDYYCNFNNIRQCDYLLSHFHLIICQFSRIIHELLQIEAIIAKKKNFENLSFIFQ